MNDWGEINADWNDKVSFVGKHKSSSKIIDFTDKESLNEIMRYSVIEKLNIKLPIKNESEFIITTKPISLLDVINYIEQTKGKIEIIYLFLYTVNDKAANYICELSKRSKLKVIISDLMNSKREKERMITRIFDNTNTEIVFCHNHAKLAAIKINDNYYVLSGSMNAGNNARIETLQISNNINLYDFIVKTYDKLKTEFQINKRY
jgi:predicted nucleic acid-binding protein